MPVPVNLYVDRLSMAPPAHLTDVYYATSEHPAEYKEAAARIGLTAEEYKEFRAALLDGNALYVKLPRRLDSMAGMHRRNHQVYALNNVVVPAGTMGWQVQLADGTQVYVPQVCGNLSMIRHGAIAKAPVRRTVAVRPRKQVKRVAAERAERPSAPAVVPPPAVAAPAESPVTFDNPATQVAVIPAAVPVAAGVAAHHFPFAALLLPLVKAFGGGGGTGPSSSGGGGGFFGGGGGGTGGGICPKK